MTLEQLKVLQDDHADLLLAITAAAKFGGSIELQLEKLELGQVARLVNLESLRIDGFTHDRYELNLTYSELEICLYALVPKL